MPALLRTGAVPCMVQLGMSVALSRSVYQSSSPRRSQSPGTPREGPTHPANSPPTPGACRSGDLTSKCAWHVHIWQWKHPQCVGCQTANSAPSVDWRRIKWPPSSLFVSSQVPHFLGSEGPSQCKGMDFPGLLGRCQRRPMPWATVLGWDGLGARIIVHNVPEA